MNPSTAMLKEKSTTTPLSDTLHWYKDAIIYELHIKAFKDGNGDGIGDFQGLSEKLDYLQWLGVTAIWLLPFYPSPLRDDGYDIADYYGINPRYGTLEEFKTLLDEAHRRGLKVITELVINHSSDQHAWFQRARNAPKDSPERDYYVWSDDPQKYKEVRIIFQDYEASNWTWDPVAGQYYWHRFFHHQPDLNFDNPAVQEEVFKMLEYWCEMGVDGFRLDAVPYLFERDGTNCENLPETHAFLKKLRSRVEEKFPGTLLLAEANMWPEDSASYFGDGDECHMNYHFPVMPRMFMSVQMEDRYPLTDIFDQTPAIPDTCQWAIFLRNHDELTLEMVTDEERDYMYKVYAKDPKARINLGIRHRLAPLLDNNRAKIELLNYLLFSLPGTPVVYYGDEIGMGDNFYLGDRDGVRTPMQWTGERNAGYSTANPQQLYLPLIIDPLYHYETVNVELQSRTASSLLWWTKRIIQTRQRSKAFGRGDMKFIHSVNAKVLSFTRTYEQETILVVANLSRFIQPLELFLEDFSGYMPVEVFSKNKMPLIEAEKAYFLTLGPYNCHWYQLQKINEDESDQTALPLLKIKSWTKEALPALLRDLENKVLLKYLPKMRWYGGKARGIESLIIKDSAILEVEESFAVILLLEVTYTEGLAEMYQLPIAFAEGETAKKLKDGCPQSVLCEIVLSESDSEETAIIYDAIYGLPLQQTFLKNLSRNTEDGPISFHAKDNLLDYINSMEKVNAKVLGVEQSNTSIVYDRNFFLKIYRKVDKTINPDVELTRYLSDVANFPNVPAYVGGIAWKTGKDTMVLGMMQNMVDNAQDGWEFMLERLKVYHEAVQMSGIAANELPELLGNMAQPVGYEEMPAQLKDLVGGVSSERTMLLGTRTGQMHKALGGIGYDMPTDLKPEDFSLHYQRSLYSSFQTLVRTAFQSLKRNLNHLPEELQQEANELLGRKDEIMLTFKRIYDHKLEAVKTRLHGDYHLGQILFTGKEVVILDFEGEPSKSYSERRIKRSPLRDVAGMIRSYHYAAYASLFLDHDLSESEVQTLMPFAEQWYHYMSGFFIKNYQLEVAGSHFIPTDEQDLKMMLETYLLEKAIYELNYELNNRPSWVVIPIRGITSILDRIKLEA